MIFFRQVQGLASERCCKTPETQSDHVGHVFRLGCPRGGDVDDARVRQLGLQLQHGQARLGGSGAAGRHQIFRPVALVEDDDAVKVGAAPLQQLLEPTPEVSARRRDADQRRVRAKDDALSDAAVGSRRDPRVGHLVQRVDLQSVFPISCYPHHI